MSAVFRHLWVSQVGQDAEVSIGSKSTAEVLASAGLVSRVASTDWQDINRALRRPARDPGVLHEIAELQRAGYLGPRQGNRFHQSRGWRLMLPNEQHGGANSLSGGVEYCTGGI
jgi:hypothetical protein